MKPASTSLDALLKEFEEILSKKPDEIQPSSKLKIFAENSKQIGDLAKSALKDKVPLKPEVHFQPERMRLTPEQIKELEQFQASEEQEREEKPYLKEMRSKFEKLQIQAHRNCDWVEQQEKEKYERERQEFIDKMKSKDKERTRDRER